MILLVDDRKENLLSLSRILEQKNFEVDTADSGVEALTKVLQREYSLIILDVQMPGMDGFEVAEVLGSNKVSRDIPIIFLSAVSIEKSFIQKGYMSGGIDYVTKPVDPDILLLKVKTFCDLYERKKELATAQRKLKKEIEERKRVQLDLELANSELQTILESLPQMAFATDATGNIIFSNQYWNEYAAPNAFPENAPQEESLLKTWKKYIPEGEPVSIQLLLKKKDKEIYRYHMLNAIPIYRNDEVIRWVGTFTDIHDQVNINHKLEQMVQDRTRDLETSNKKLLESNTQLQQFTSVSSHDLKEPLRKIQVFSSIIKDKLLEEDYESIEGFVDKIQNSSRRMMDLVHDLVNYSKISLQKDGRLINLNQIVGDIILDIETTVDDKEIQIEVGILPEVFGIPSQMRQVFQNLISNAIKFSDKGENPVVKIWAERVSKVAYDARPDTSGKAYKIYVQDQGIGFNMEFIDKIFTIFQRLDNSARYEGTGIGLAIAKKIVEINNGLITAEGIPGKGATFMVILPNTEEHGDTKSI